MHDDALVFGIAEVDARVDGELGRRVDAPREPNALCAYLACRQMLDELWVLNVAVAPTARRQGLARRLLRCAFASATARGCSSTWLEVRAHNKNAHALYVATGFIERGRRPGYYPPLPGSATRDTAILMSRAVLLP